MATDGSASAASEIEVGSIYPTMLELRAAAAKQAANTCVARVVWCGMRRMDGLAVRRHSYRGHRMDIWRIFDWLTNDKKQFKVRVDKLACPWALFGQKQVRCAVNQWNGSWGMFLLEFRIYLFLAPNGPGVHTSTCF